MNKYQISWQNKADPEETGSEVVISSSTREALEHFRYVYIGRKITAISEI